MSRIADDYYIKQREKEQALEFMQYMVNAARNYFMRLHGPIPAKGEPKQSRKRNSPRKWTDHPVHGETFRAMNAQMTTLRTHLRELQEAAKAGPNEAITAQIDAVKNLIATKHREYDALRKAVSAEEA
jgi:hypothetical protein